MRVLTLTTLYPNPLQPHRATFNRHQVRLLSERHPVRVVAPIAWTDELASRKRTTDRIPGSRRVSLDGLTVAHPRYFFPPKVMRGQYGRFYESSVRSTVNRVIAEFRPDLIYTPWAYPDGWAAVRLARRAGIPAVIKVHGSDVLLLGQHEARRKPTAEALRQADAVIAVSRDLAERVVGLGADPARVHVVYDGIDTEEFRPGSLVDARTRLGLDPVVPVILSVGNLVPVKGQDILIDACAILAGRGVNFMCHLIGQGPLRARLERRAGERGLGDRFRMPGAVANHLLPDWYRAANVFALPSHSEGVPNVLLEAASCGTPFVASRVGGIPEIAHLVRSHLVAPGDANDLAKALSERLSQPPGPVHEASPVRHRSETVTDLERIFSAVTRSYAQASAASASEPGHRGPAFPHTATGET